MKKVLWLIVCLMAMTLSSCEFGTNGSKSNWEDSISTAHMTSQETIDSITDASLPFKNWHMETEIDQMTDAENYYARLLSNNKVLLNFPFDDTRALIGIRCTEKYGNEAMIILYNGLIFGDKNEGENYIEARFNGKPMKKYIFSEAVSGSSEVVFVQNAKDFIKECKEANDIKITIPIYQNGRKLFTFHTDSLLIWGH